MQQKQDSAKDQPADNYHHPLGSTILANFQGKKMIQYNTLYNIYPATAGSKQHANQHNEFIVE